MFTMLNLNIELNGSILINWNGIANTTTLYNIFDTCKHIPLDCALGPTRVLWNEKELG